MTITEDPVGRSVGFGELAAGEVFQYESKTLMRLNGNPGGWNSVDLYTGTPRVITITERVVRRTAILNLLKQ